MSSPQFQVYFGGTFDPPHRGHFDMLNALVRDAWVEKIWLTPTHINPLKNLSTEVAAFGDAATRRQWLDLWLNKTREQNGAELSSKVELNTSELEAGVRNPDQPSFTVDSLRALISARDPQQKGRWALALGSDSLAHLEKWKDIASLLKLLDSVWVFRRGPEPLPLQKVPAALRDLCQWRLMGSDVFDVSSSEIRKQLLAGLRPAAECLVPGLRDALPM